MAMRIGGMLYFKIDGTQYSARGSFEIQPMPLEREGVVGMDGPHGFIEKPKIQFIEGEISAIPGVSVQQLNDVDDSTVTADLNNGSSYVVNNGWQATNDPLNAAEGKIKLKFEGLAMTETVSAS
jgi:hypothetical protein